MTPLANIISTVRIARLSLLFGSAIIFASLAAAGQAESLYPQTIEQARSADILRPGTRTYQYNCTQLELLAQISPAECGTLTLSDVVGRLVEIGDDDNGK